MRLDRLTSRAIGVLVTLGLSLPLCMAQNSSNASLEGGVRDPSGALKKRPEVQLRNMGRRQATTQTNQKGEARFNKVDPGRYQVHVEAPGFKPQDTEAFTLTSGVDRK